MEQINLNECPINLEVNSNDYSFTIKEENGELRCCASAHVRGFERTKENTIPSNSKNGRKAKNYCKNIIGRMISIGKTEVDEKKGTIKVSVPKNVSPTGFLVTNFDSFEKDEIDNQVLNISFCFENVWILFIIMSQLLKSNTSISPQVLYDSIKAAYNNLFDESGNLTPEGFSKIMKALDLLTKQDQEPKQKKSPNISKRKLPLTSRPYGMRKIQKE